MPAYRKLVRDRIPDIIASKGKRYSTRILDDAEYRAELRRKLGEELHEYLEAEHDGDALEELADVLELIRTLASVHGADIAELEQIRAKKAEERGGFAKKIFLIDVSES